MLNPGQATTGPAAAAAGAAASSLPASSLPELQDRADKIASARCHFPSELQGRRRPD
jgi:hypothetical protein